MRKLSIKTSSDIIFSKKKYNYLGLGFSVFYVEYKDRSKLIRKAISLICRIVEFCNVKQVIHYSVGQSHKINILYSNINEPYQHILFHIKPQQTIGITIQTKILCLIICCWSKVGKKLSCQSQILNTGILGHYTPQILDPAWGTWPTTVQQLHPPPPPNIINQFRRPILTYTQIFINIQIHLAELFSFWNPILISDVLWPITGGLWQISGPSTFAVSSHWTLLRNFIIIHHPLIRNCLKIQGWALGPSLWTFGPFLLPLRTISSISW